MTFKGMVDKCQMMKDNGTEACDCWSNDNFTALVTTIRSVPAPVQVLLITSAVQGLQAERRPEGGDCAAEELQDRVLCLQTGEQKVFSTSRILFDFKTKPTFSPQAEDDGMKAMSSCATSKADLLASAKTLTENSAGIDAAKTKVRIFR